MKRIITRKKKLLSIMLCMLVLGTSVPSISAIKDDENIRQISTIDDIIEEAENRYFDQEEYESCISYSILKKLCRLGAIFIFGCILIIRYIRFLNEAWWVRPGYHDI